MGLKESLEKLIQDSYQVLRENDQQILFADPNKKLQLRRANDEAWGYISEHLADYTNLCEFLELAPLEEIVHIAAFRYPELLKRLKAITSPGSKTTPSAAPLIIPSTTNDPLFQIDYRFVRPFVPIDEDKLVQIVVRFRCREDVQLSTHTLVTHVCLLLDVSGSMEDPAKYPYLLKAIPIIIDALSEKDMLTVILFSSNSEMVWSDDIASCRADPQTLVQRVEQSNVKFETTLLEPGLKLAIDAIKRFHQAQSEAVTRLYILTDGQIQDIQRCISLNTELQPLGVEVNAYGFGKDFAEDNLYKLMDGCPGGRVKHISDTEMIKHSFRHIGDVARNIVAGNANFEMAFSPHVTLGDAFRFEPGTLWLKAVDDQNKNFRVHVGSLEKQRDYIYAFEARVYPSQENQEHIASATLRFLSQGRQHSIQQKIWIQRTEQIEPQEQIDLEAQNIFKELEVLRRNDPATQKVSFEARLARLRSRGGDPAQIRLLEKALEELSHRGNLENFSPREQTWLDVDDSSTMQTVRISKDDYG